MAPRAITCVTLDALLVLSGCASSDPDEPASVGTTGGGPATRGIEGSDAETSGGSTGKGTSAGTTGRGSSTGGEDPVAFCSGLVEESECTRWGVEPYFCSWDSLIRVTRTGDTCEVGRTASLCLARGSVGGFGGCSSVPGCQDAENLAPLYRLEDDGSVLIHNFCGSPDAGPVGFSPCKSGLPDATPGECACVCSLFDRR